MGTVRRRFQRAGATSLLGFMLIGTSAVGQEVDDATKNAARELAQRGSEAYVARDYETAQDLFHRAYTLLQAPTLSLREARALVELGRWVEAVEAYVRTVRTKLVPKAPKAFQEAIATAQAELEQLRPRLPQLEIVVEGADAGEELMVTMDGKPVQRALLGVATPVNPGKHELHANTGSGVEAGARIELAEGEKQRIVLRLEASRTAPAETPPPLNVLAPPEHTPSKGGTQRTLGFVALGLGGAGLAAGVVTGLMATSRHSSAERQCPERRCIQGSDGEQQLREFRQLRTISTIGYVAGGVCAAAGITLLLTAPSRVEGDHAQVHAYLSPVSVGLVGKF